MNFDENDLLCSQCKQNTERSPAGRLYVEWSSEDTFEDSAIRAELKRDGCVAEMFCCWDCAGLWFSRGRPPRKATQAGRDLHPQQ
jgi:hypothetical protein